MAVTTTPIGVGSAPNDGTGDPARTGGQTANTNFSNLDAAVEELQSGKWELDNTGSTLAIGERHVANSHAGITKTLPAAGAASTTGFNTCWIFNADTNSNITVAPDGTDGIYVSGASLGAGTNMTLLPNYVALLIQKSGGWDCIRWLADEAATTAINDISDVTITGPATDDVLRYSGSAWVDSSLEEADIVARDTPAIEVTPYLKHETRAARSSGTETITCSDDPSVYLPIGGNNVTINLDVPALSLPTRGLNDVKLCGKVFVKMNGAYTGLTVTTDAGTTPGTFPKGTAPSTSGEYAILVWEWFDDGTTDLMWAEWITE